jgi:hypothetical protein
MLAWKVALAQRQALEDYSLVLIVGVLALRRQSEAAPLLALSRSC